MAGFGQLTRIQNALNHSAIAELHGATVEAGRWKPQALLRAHYRSDDAGCSGASGLATCGVRRDPPMLQSLPTRRGQSAIWDPIRTVRSLGSPKWSMGLAALRAIAMKSPLRQDRSGRAEVGVMVMRDTK